MLNEPKSLSQHERDLVTSRYELLAFAFGIPLMAAVPGLRGHPALARVCVLSMLGLAGCSAAWFRPNEALDLPTYSHMLVCMMLEGAHGLRARRRRVAEQAW